MNKTGATIQARVNNYLVGGHIASGALADVYAVTTVDGEVGAQWVLKILKDESGASDDEYLNSEYKVITQLQSSLLSTEARVLPRAELVSVGSQKALLLERVQGSMSQYVRDYGRNHEPIEVEAEIWRIAYRYAEFITKMQLQGYTCNDRKLDDFYYYRDERIGDYRLVVLDWNVIEEIDQSKNGVWQDARLLARAWFGLLGGSDEALFDMNTRLQGDFSVAGRGFLWKTLSADLIKETYTDPRQLGKDLMKYIQEIIDLFEGDKDQLRRKLDALWRELPRDLENQAEDSAALDLALLKYWRVADMLARRSGVEPQELKEITAIRERFRRSEHEEIADSLKVKSLALEGLADLKMKGSERRKTLISAWKRIITDVFDPATNEGISLEPLRKIAEKYGETFSRFITGSYSIEQETEAFNQLRDLFQHLLTSPHIIESKAVKATLQARFSQVDICLLYLKGEKALQRGDAPLALTAFKEVINRTNQLPGDLAQITHNLLPINLDAMIKRIAAVIPSNATNDYRANILELLQEGKFEGAIQQYEAAKNSSYISLIDLWMVQDWLEPAYRLRALQGNSGDWSQLLDSAQAVAVYAQEYPALHPLLNQVLAKATSYFMKISDKQSMPKPSMDEQALELGTKIRDLMTKLEAPNKEARKSKR